jgi:hypothetical protein
VPGARFRRAREGNTKNGSFHLPIGKVQGPCSRLGRDSRCSWDCRSGGMSPTTTLKP